MSGLYAVGPIAEVVDLSSLRYLSSGLDEGGPVGQFLLSVNGQDAVAVLVQAVFPYPAVAEGAEGRVYLHGDPEAVGRGDRAFSPASARPRVPGLRVVAIPPSDDGVPLNSVVSRHPSCPLSASYIQGPGPGRR